MAHVNVDVLLSRLEEQRVEIEHLKKELGESRRSGSPSNVNGTGSENDDAPAKAVRVENFSQQWPLETDEYTRYGRQMILPEIGLKGQTSLRNASVLILGLGGLGCPAAAYLASAGVGTLGLVDGDIVELSNLHRQILHSTDRLGQLKVESAAQHLRQLNPEVKYNLYPKHLSPTNALDIFADYNLVLDCTDHPTSRYLISDAAVLSGLPLVSGSALRTDGQLLILNNPPGKAGAEIMRGPCYRCVFPKPPPVESVISCGEGGILGPVVGVMGVLMAVESIKLLASRGREASPTTILVQESDSSSEHKPTPASMLIYSAFSSPAFHSLRIRGARSDCQACSTHATITKDSLRDNTLDYAAFCGVAEDVKLLGPAERLSAVQLAESLLHDGQLSDPVTSHRAGDQTKTKAAPSTVIIDVRDKTQFEICNLPGSINIPLTVLQREQRPATTTTATPLPSSSTTAPSTVSPSSSLSHLYDLPSSTKLLTVCRFGNDSQIAARKLQELGFATPAGGGGEYGHHHHDDDGDGEDDGVSGGKRWIGDLQGGLEAWRRDVDPSWPNY